MSGGVDSSVAAGLMVEAGYDVIGITMKLRDTAPEEKHSTAASCCSPSDLNDARRVCDELGIAHYILDYREVFRQTVIEPFARDYVNGLTPNPCVQCNDHVKFAPLMERAAQLGADYLVTGHYARIVKDEDGAFFLQRGVDHSKDQSYFLFGLGQAELSRLMFPLGGMDKDEVRSRAKDMGIATWDKPDSEDICFVPNGDYTKIVEKFAEPESVKGRGLVKTSDGEVLGEHDGIHRYTIGQRRGLGLTSSERLYVTGLNAETNEVYVGARESLRASGLQARDCSWATGVVPDGSITCSVCIRFRHPGVTAEVIALGERAIVRFESPEVAVAPGQAVVFYKGDIVLGGGWIGEATFPTATAHA